ncbi:MAG: glycosyltransferase family 4 protein [Deltaproteobacteria bacterium]
MKVKSYKVLIVAGFAESIVNFRGELIKDMVRSGHEVHVCAPNFSDETLLSISEFGAVPHEVFLERTGTNFFSDLQYVFSMWCLMRSIKPDLCLCYTIKAVVYGTLSAWLAGVKHRVILITGVGYAFGDKAHRSIVGRIARLLYRVALRCSELVFFQNHDDKSLFQQLGLLRDSTRSVVVNGSGVDLSYFYVAPLPDMPPVFLLIARLLVSKGVREYVEVAKHIKKKHPEVRFLLVGWIDTQPDAIQQSELDDWIASGSIEYLGKLSDVRPAITQSSVYVLPSYSEGTPRTVLEAMAMGRAVITTDAPGCRETVVDGYNGFLVPVKSVDALEQAMCRFIDSPKFCTAMGQNSRIIAERKYDVRKVNKHMLQEMNLI